MTDRGLTLTTTVRVIAGVHDRTADGRADTHVTLTSSLTNIYEVVVTVSDNTDCCSTLNWNHSHLA